MLHKNLTYFILLIVLLSAAAEHASGQRWKMRRYEIGGGLGMTQVFGDIGGTISQQNWFGLRDIRLDETSLAFPLYGRYRLTPFYTLKVNATLGFGHGDDLESRNDRGRSYKTMLTELSGQVEYYFFPEERRYKSAAMFNRRGMLNNYMSFSSYVFLGLGGVYSRAHVTFTEDMYPYDRIKANNIGMVVPFGIGLKYTISDRWLAGAELGYRISITDYIEGYSQTQDSKHNDVYYFLGVSIGYKLQTSRRGIPSIFDRQSRKAKSNIEKQNKKRIPKSAKEAKE
jgi:OmpA-OmpF porin, OOP family